MRRIDREFLARLICARIRIAHAQRHGRSIRSVREVGEKLRARPNHSVVRSVDRVSLDHALPQIRALRRIRETRFEQRHQLGRPRPPEVRRGALLLHGRAIRRIRVIQQQRKHAVKKSGMRVHRRHVAIQRQIARPEMHRLLRRVEDHSRQRPQRVLRHGIVPPRQAVERVVIPRGFVVIVRRFEQPPQRQQFIGGPRRLPRVPFAGGIPPARAPPRPDCSAAASSKTIAPRLPDPSDSPLLPPARDPDTHAGNWSA